MIGSNSARRISNTMAAALLAASGSMGLAATPAHADSGATSPSQACLSAIAAFVQGLSLYARGGITLGSLTLRFQTMARDCGLPTTLSPGN